MSNLIDESAVELEDRSVFEQVQEFNDEVLSIPRRPLGLMPEEEKKLSVIQLKEEIREFEDAYAAGDVGEVVDAMVDLIYFACGVIYKNGVNHDAAQAVFDAVHRANMLKAAGKKAARGYDGDAQDAVKPADWTPPDVNEILRSFEPIKVEVVCKKEVVMEADEEHGYPGGEVAFIEGKRYTALVYHDGWVSAIDEMGEPEHWIGADKEADLGSFEFFHEYFEVINNHLTTVSG